MNELGDMPCDLSSLRLRGAAQDDNRVYPLDTRGIGGFTFIVTVGQLMYGLGIPTVLGKREGVGVWYRKR